MRIVSAVKSELLKNRHTAFPALHIVMPVLGAAVFLLYFLNYPKVGVSQKMRLISEVTAVFFPVLISAAVGIHMLTEEKASHFYGILAVPDRKKVLLGKLLVLYASGVGALALLCGLWCAGMLLWNRAGQVPWLQAVQLTAGMAVAGLFSYVFHLFVNMRAGLGVSVFFGVFESMQSIMYSNVELRGGFRYIPFAWSMEWIKDVMNGSVRSHLTDYAVVMLLTAVALMASLVWFEHWGGRKSYE